MLKYPHKKYVLSIAIIILLLSGVILPVSAAVVSWTGNGENDVASNPSNWSDNIKPQYGDDVIFDATSVSCTWDLNITVRSFELYAGYSGTVLINADLDITGGLNIQGGALINQQRITVGAEIPSLPPSATTDAATNINGNAATLQSTINPLSGVRIRIMAISLLLNLQEMVQVMRCLRITFKVFL